jgi:dihydroxyacid dehydratase/phosphogluconate dehydratase
MVDIDLTKGKLDVRLSQTEITQRLSELPPFKSNTHSKWLKRYSYFVTSADTGAVLSEEVDR